MEWLNFHHLRYFWTVARKGSVRKAADEHRLDVQDYPADQIDGWLLLLHGIFCRLLRGKSVREIYFPGPLFRNLLVGWILDVHL
jgi:hypothetical protein